MKLTKRSQKCPRCGGSGRRRYVEGAVPVLDKNNKQIALTTVSGTVTCLGCNGTGQA